MELLALGGVAFAGYLYNQRERETNFVTENSVPLSMVADQYASFNDPRFQNIVGCTGSYPVYNMPSISQDDQGYINYMNQRLGPYAQNLNTSQINVDLTGSQVPGLAYNQQPNYVQGYGGMEPPPGGVANNNYYPEAIPRPNETLQNFEQMQQTKTQSFNQMILEQNPFKKKVHGTEGFTNSINHDTPTLGNGNQLMEEHVNFIPANDPTSDFLLDMQSRPNTDFSHNNMVPFFGPKVTQNMAGTGVAQGNYIDGVTVDTGFDQTTPYQSKLNDFTGMDDTYMHKRETGPMFSPAEQQTGWVFGQPNFRPDTEQYTQSMVTRNDLAPVQPEMVGPGLDIDPSIPASGGFHEFTRVMPNNVSDYKANQLEGRVNNGKWVSGGELPTSYPGVGVEGELDGSNHSGPGVPKNRPNTFWDQARRPTMTTKAGGMPNQEFLKSQWEVDFKPNNAMRAQTNHGYGELVPIVNQLTGREEFSNTSSGAGEGFCLSVSDAVGIMPSRPDAMGGVRDPTYMSQDNNINSISDCNSVPIGNPARPGQAQGNPLSNYYVNETDRGSINPTSVEQINLKGTNMTTFYTYDDAPKTTMKETNNYSYNANPERESTGATFYTYEDVPKTTMKETNQFSYNANPERESTGATFYTYEDAPKTTMKETNNYSYHANPERESTGATFYTYGDKPKPTIKQSTEFTYHANPERESTGATFYTYGDKPKPTIKQSTEFTYHGNPDLEGKAPTFYTYEDKPKPTIKASTEFSYLGPSAREDQGTTFYTYQDKPKPSIRESTNFSYSGNLAKGDKAETSRYLFTGPELKTEAFANLDFNSLRGQNGIDSPFNAQFKPKVGGADTFTIRGTTLVEDYMPGPGRSNIRQDADFIQGRIDFGTFGTEVTNGPGTLTQALPSAARLQNAQIMSTPHAAPNKLFGMDDRQLASFQVEQKKNNPLDIFTTNPNGEVPSFFQSSAPDDYSTMINERDSQTDTLLKSQKVPKATNPKGGIGGLEPVNIYPPNADVLEVNKNNNPNMNIVDNNQSIDSKVKFNRMIGQGSSRAVNGDPIFSGKGYSGNFGKSPGSSKLKKGRTNPNNQITIGGPDPPKVYGDIGKVVPRQSNDVGMIDHTMGNEVCIPNDALDFATPLVLNK